MVRGDGVGRRYEGERDDLMQALGQALTELNGLGAHYPRWVWDRYERGRTTSSLTWFRADV